MSDILRLIAGGLLALICCYMGLLIKRRYKEREKFYMRAVQFTTALQSELSLHKTPIPDIAKSFTKGETSHFDNMLNDYINASSEGKNEDLKIANNILKKDEKGHILKFLSSLGKTNLDDQLAMIGGYAKMFESERDKCAKENKQMGAMYFKLSVLLGLALILILS